MAGAISIATVFCVLVASSLAEGRIHWTAEILEGRVKTSVVTGRKYVEKSLVALSKAMPLAPGGMVFSIPEETPMLMPEGNYAITGFYGEVVDSENNSVPLSTCYDHHWIAEDKYHVNEICPNGPQYVFGIGAESRTTPVTFPDGYGYVVPGDDAWGANIHLLHTVGLAGDNAAKAVKECNECYYAPGKGPYCSPERNGTFQCCGEGLDHDEAAGRCPTQSWVDPTNTTDFFLRYRVNYTYDVENIIPAKIGVYTAPGCKAYYGVYRNDAQPESLASNEFEVPRDAEVILAIGHQHTGALNISLYKNGDFVCASYPTYGTEDGVAGNEKGYLVKMSPCLSDDRTLSLKKGDKVRLDSWYWVGSEDPRLAPLPGGTHLNVMGYMYMAYTESESHGLNTTLALP